MVRPAARRLRERALHASFALLVAATAGCGPAGGPPTPRPPDLTKRAVPRPPGADDIAGRRFAAPLSLADAEAILHGTQVFAFGGMPPKRQVQAFNVVFEQPDAVSRLHRPAGAASAAGRLYALAGLLLLDRPAAVRLQGTLAADPQRILVVDADVYYKKPISELAATIERRDAGTWFRQVRDETMAYYAKSR